MGMGKLKKRSLLLLGLLAIAAVCYAGTSNFDSVDVTPTANDSYGLVGRNSSGTIYFFTDPDGKTFIGDRGVTSVHTYSSSATWTLSTAESQCVLLLASGSAGSGTMYIVAPARTGAMYVVRAGTATGSTVTIKASATTGISVAAATTAIVIYDGTDYRRITADATH